jgi:hypothetical protein
MTDPSVRTAVLRLVREGRTAFTVSDIATATGASPALAARLLVDLIGDWASTATTPAFALRRVGRGAYHIVPAEIPASPSAVRPSAAYAIAAPEIGSSTRAHSFVLPPMVAPISPEAREAIAASAVRMREALSRVGPVFAPPTPAPPKWYRRGVLGRLGVTFDRYDWTVGIFIEDDRVWFSVLPCVSITYDR